MFKLPTPMEFVHFCLFITLQYILHSVILYAFGNKRTIQLDHRDRPVESSKWSSVFTLTSTRTVR